MLTRSNRTEAAVRTFKSGKLLCGVCSAALALASWLPSPASAGTYTAGNASQLQADIAAANASSDPSSTITLTNSFTLPSNTNLTMPAKSITIDTQGFVLSGATGVGNGSITFVSGVLPSVVMTVNGTLVGGNSAGIGNPGAGLSIQSSAGSTGQVVNNGSITGGNATVVGKYGAVGAAMFIGSTLVNNGTITGGVANAYARPAGSIQGSGVSLNTGSALINNAGATVLGGNSQGIGAGAGLYMDATGGAVTATNYGTIRGGSDLAGVVAGNAAVQGLSGNATTSSLTNFGLLEGGNGAAAISADGTWNIAIVNSGTIRAGTGQSNAIVFGQTAASTSSLELQAGSSIQGNVIGNALGASTLILGGDDDASFDVSAVGPQYQNFTSFQKTGNSTWSLTGTGTVATPWVISQGTLQIGDGTATGSIIGDVTDNANLAFNRSDVFTFGNTITGTGSVTQVGTGTTILTGTSTYTGPTTVTGGTLSVNGSIATSAVTVASGGTLGGHGTVGATTIQSGGNVAPGNSIGTLHINGAFAQNSGSVYKVEVDPTSNTSDLILVNGTATIASGATMNVIKNPAGDYRMDAQYTVLTASGGVTGSYALTGQTAVTQYLALQEQQDANNIYLRVVRTSDPADAAQTGNQAQTATGTDSLPNTSNVGSAVLNTPDPGTTRSAFDALSGEAIASAKNALISGSLLVRDTTFDRLRDVFCASDETHRTGNHTACSSQSDKPTLWAQGFGSWGHVAGNGNASALSESVGGFLVGVDMPVYDWRVGYFGGFSRTDFDVKARSSSGNSNSYHLGMYGGTQWGDLGLRLGASYSWNGLATDRSVTVGDLSNDLSANYNAGTTQVFGELGQRFGFDRFVLEPFANVAYVNLRTAGFSETGGDAALTARADTTEDTFTTLGVRPSTDISWGSFNATARGMAGWRHAFGDVTPSSTVSFAGSDAFTVTGVPLGRDAGVVEAGLDFTIHDNVTAGITYGGQFSSRETDHSIRGAVAITF